MNKSHLTAIARSNLPTPTRWLIKQGYIGGDVLDYGCGRCAELNNRLLGGLKDVKSVFNYDPYYAPKIPAHSQFDRIICNYVLCVVPEKEEKKILHAIQRMLKNGGAAFISVRNDTPKQGYGFSSRKTFQRKVELNLTLFKKTREYRMYLLNKTDKI